MMKTRRLGRTDIELSPFGMLVGDSGTAHAPSELPNWCDIPAELDADTWNRVARGLRTNALVVARVGPGAWDRAMLPACTELLKRIDRSAVDIWQLSMLDIERVKAGEPFRMMIKLKDLGHVRHFSIRVNSARDAMWVIEHTPIHCVTVDLPYEEPVWKELLAAAKEAGTGLIGTTRTAGGDLHQARDLLAATTITAFSWPARLVGGSGV